MGALYSTVGGQSIKTISITSGKGGVGKSTIVANLALQMAALGKRVLILDGDLGMGNVDLMFGLGQTDALAQVLNGERALSDIIVELDHNVHLIPGGSGLYELTDLNDVQKSLLIDQVSGLEGLYDVMLIDTAPGIDSNVLYLNSAAQEIVVVMTPDPASLADSYALIKVLHQRCRENTFSVVCNMVRDELEAKMVFKRLSDVANQFLCVGLKYRGFIPLDPSLRKATKSQQLILKSNPRCPSSFALKRLGENLSDSSQVGEIKGGLQFFWQQMVGVA